MNRVVIDKEYGTVTRRKKAFQLTNKLRKQIYTEGVIEEQHELALRKRESNSVAFHGSDWRPFWKQMLDTGHIFAGNLGQTWRKLNSRNAAEWKFTCHDHRAALAAPQIDKLIFIRLSKCGDGAP